MRKVALSSALLLSSLAMFLRADPGYSQWAPVVQYCTPDPTGHEASVTCYSGPDVGTNPGDLCTKPGTYFTQWLCSGTLTDQICCKCSTQETSLAWKIHPDPIYFEPRVWINSSLGLNSVSVYSSQNVRIEIPEFEPGIVLPIVQASSTLKSG